MTRKDLSTSRLALRRQGDLSATGYIPYVDRMRKLVDRWDVCGFRVASLSSSSASLFSSLPRSCHPRRRRGTYPFPRARRLSLPSRQAHPGNYLSLLLSFLSLWSKIDAIPSDRSASKGNRPCSSRSEITNPRLLWSALTSTLSLWRYVRARRTQCVGN